MEKFLGACFLRGDLVARLVELPDRPAMLDQPSTQLQERKHLTRQPAQRFHLFESKSTRLKIQDA